MCFRCTVKQYLPPEGYQVRRCLTDSLEYISTCPDHAKKWRISELCENGPTSFVYEKQTLEELIDPQALFERVHTEIGQHGAEYQTYFYTKKYRNSYCASCHGAAWLGCNNKGNLKVNGTELQKKKHFEFQQDVKKYLFVYQIDFNKRLCNMDSDSVLLYSNFNTRFDTCVTITKLLRQCDCQNSFNLETEKCITLPIINEKYCDTIYSNQTFKLSNYAIKTCEKSFAYVPTSQEHSEQECLKCQNRSANCDKVYSRYGAALTPYKSIHCAANVLVGCKPQSNEASCFRGFAISHGRGGSTLLVPDPLKMKTLLQNSVAIRYMQVDFTFGVKLIAADGNGKYNLSNCIEYRNINHTTQWLVCGTGEIYDPEENVRYKDFVLNEEEAVRVCAKYAPQTQLLSLQFYHYMLSAASILFIASYTIYYFTRCERSVTENCYVSCLLSLMTSLISFCLIHYHGSPTSCRVIASFNQYFTLSTHTWVNVMAILVVKSISGINIATDRNWKTYARYAAYAWLTPLPFVIITIIFASSKGQVFYPVYSTEMCYITGGWARLLTLTGPILLLGLVNIIMCVAAAATIWKNAEPLPTTMPIPLVVKLQLVIGVCWIFMFIVDVKGLGNDLPGVSSIWKAYTAVQGILVVLARVLTAEKVKYLKSLVCKRKKHRREKINSVALSKKSNELTQLSTKH